MSARPTLRPRSGRSPTTSRPEPAISSRRRSLSKPRLREMTYRQSAPRRAISARAARPATMCTARRMTDPDAAEITAAPQAIAVWDLPTRLFHWVLVGLIGFSWWTGEQGPENLHMYSGYAV